MASDRFREALPLVLVHEGGYVNHPADPGGETNKGVTRRVYDAHRRRLGQPTRSVRHITESELQAIYRRQYWDAVRGDDLPAGLDYAMFDYAVNSGTSRAIKALQRVLRAERIDGHLGEVTLAAVAEADADVLIRRLCDERLGFLRSLRHYKTFGRGWESRVRDVRVKAMRMADGPVERPAPKDDVAPKPASDDATVEPASDAPEGMPKAQEPKPSIWKSTEANAATAVGVLAGVKAAAEGADTVKQAATSFDGVISVATNPYVIGAVVVVALAVYIWNRRRWRMETQGV